MSRIGLRPGGPDPELIQIVKGQANSAGPPRVNASGSVLPMVLLCAVGLWPLALFLMSRKDK